MKHLLKLSALTPAELTRILDVADQLKAQQAAGGTPPLLAGKSVALMFSKASTRTRASFAVGVGQLGGMGHYMNAATELQSGGGEPLRDTARAMVRSGAPVTWQVMRWVAPSPSPACWAHIYSAMAVSAATKAS